MELKVVLLWPCYKNPGQHYFKNVVGSSESSEQINSKIERAEESLPGPNKQHFTSMQESMNDSSNQKIEITLLIELEIRVKPHESSQNSIYKN